MSTPKAAEVKKGIAVIWENLQCPICLDLMSKPISTRCDHQFCKFCMMKLLDRSKRKETNCPICKTKVTKRSLQESPGFQKLVEGLQSLVQSYEFDTSTNYFTGMAQRRQGASIETESRDQMCSGENTVSEGDVLEKGLSLTSTTAAKDAFAKLMCLEDSHAANSDQDCLQESSKKSAEPEDVPLTAEESKGGSEDESRKSLRRSGRTSKRIGLDPERIVNKRQKKSVEIVSEWLLRNSPASAAQTEGDGEDAVLCSTESDTEKDSTGSAAAEKVIVKEIDKAGRGLEERVFGAVYKRERRGSKSKVPDVFSALKEVVPDLQPSRLVEEEEKIKPKRTSGRKLTPADFVIKPLCDDKEDGYEDQEDAGEPCEGAVCDSKEGKGPENLVPSARPDEQTLTVSNPDENHNDEVETAEESPAFEVPSKRRGRRSRVRTQGVWQDVDPELTEQENGKKDRKRRVARNSEHTKNAKYGKSLSLVSAGDATGDPPQEDNPKLVETEVTIESYPSSSEPKSPDVRKTRRSLRLQEFTAEVQGPPKRRRSKLAFPKPAEERDALAQTNTGHGEPNGGDARVKTRAVSRMNGCVCSDDFEKIEAVQSSEEASERGNVEEPLVSAVPDTKDQKGCSPTVVTTPNPLEAAVPDCSFPQKRQESPSAAAAAPFIEASIPGQKGAVEDCDTNDSELDTEQLMKTFKATKRKSFYLGSPRSAQSETGKKTVEGDEPEGKDQAEEAETRSALNQTQNCSGSQVSKSLALPKVGQTDFLKDSGTSVSSALSPNKVVESQDSRLPPNSCLLFSNTITQEASQICGSTGTMKSAESPKCLSILKDDQGVDLQAKPDLVSDKCFVVSSGPETNSGVVCNAESSVTPDGLVPHNAASQTVKLPDAQSSAKAPDEVLSQPRLLRKRKAQRLDSSDSESSNGEDLPSVAQIFRYQRVPSQPDRVLERSSNVLSEQNQRSDPINSVPSPEALSSRSSQSVNPNEKQGPPALLENPLPARQGDPGDPCGETWINSSQGSVDLFGTPEECEDEDGAYKVGVDTGLSIDSTQYSSEILNTQQKEEMQQELRRLEKMMALVSEALQKKECESECRNETPDNNESSAGRRCSVTDQAEPTAAPEETLTNKRRSESSRKVELVASGLGAGELKMVKKLAKKVQGCVSGQVTPGTSHVIMKTNDDLVCERTLKYFQGIAGRKWVVSFLWISECFKQEKVLDESAFEVRGDVVNGPDHNGPRKARTASEDKLLMQGCEICFQGSFTDMTTDQMETMVELCGATVIKDPLLFSKQGNRYQLVVVQPGSDDSQSYYTALQKKATVVTRSWLLDSIATYTLQNPKDYKP